MAKYETQNLSTNERRLRDMPDIKMRLARFPAIPNRRRYDLLDVVQYKKIYLDRIERGLSREDVAKIHGISVAGVTRRINKLYAMLEEERHTYSVTVWRTETSKRTVTIKVPGEPTQENIIEEAENQMYNGDFDEVGADWQTLSCELDTVEIHGEVNRRPISVRKEET